jgi:hypothetical protein
MNRCEQAIVKIMTQEGCVSQKTMITPDDLFAKCAKIGFTDSEEVSEAIIILIDYDILEYEMDENLQTTQLWLLQY